MDKLRTPTDIGEAVRAVRKDSGLTTTEIATRSGRTRDVLHRLERGDGVSLASFVDLLAAMGHGIQIVRLGRPTLDEMTQRRERDQDDEE